MSYLTEFDAIISRYRERMRSDPKCVVTAEQKKVTEQAANEEISYLASEWEASKMSFGTEMGVPWGFTSVRDWLESVILSFPAPWSLAPLVGKYYGTEILDARGVTILSFWESEGEPSHRQKAALGEPWTPEAWNDYICDNHWESAKSLEVAETAIQLRNKLTKRSYYQNDSINLLITIVISLGHWPDEVYAEVQCGGPDRRAIEPSDPYARQILGLADK